MITERSHAEAGDGPPIEERIVAREARITEILGRGAVDELTDNDLRAINHLAHVEYYGRFSRFGDRRIAAALQHHIDRLHSIESGEEDQPEGGE